MKEDHFRDPDAPRANRLWPVVQVAVRTDEGLLLIERADDGYWALPGGLVDVGETFAHAAVREAREETGYEVEVTGLVGLYSDPEHVTSYDDGTVSQECSMVFRARVVGGVKAVSDESTQVRFVKAEEIENLRMHPSMRLRVEHALGPGGEPYLG
ncbi:NUDIX domain-containing protein [Lentzea sp. BCCO 10_0856]|uniref:NUDIX domain-containing protein n=1 Tax=Lentzea miocenica TaxID=3095431 RepID=A0ABU4TAS8_9PSEU|nr:NUDIX domain-containing protein [Lentzea sp. BCCO 10_0856]MDX8035154.1 NUDIX domain-containing protein [Lentzea sp. BCCO 10_0856]